MSDTPAPIVVGIDQIFGNGIFTNNVQRNKLIVVLSAKD
jgi:hypothetical protein